MQLILHCREKLLVSSSSLNIYISQMTAPSRGKALSVDFFSLCCYLSPQTQHIQTRGYWSITWLHLLQILKLISYFSSIVFTASFSRFPRTSKHISNIYHMYFPWCATNMSVEGGKQGQIKYLIEIQLSLKSLLCVGAHSLADGISDLSKTNTPVM